MSLRHILAAALASTLGFALACGGGTTSCKSACDTLAACGLKSSGLSCDTTCSQGDCAACLTSSSCADIEKGACNARCPGASFSKK